MVSLTNVEDYWFRDVSSVTGFTRIQARGTAEGSSSWNTNAVRPFILQEQNVRMYFVVEMYVLR